MKVVQEAQPMAKEGLRGKNPVSFLSRKGCRSIAIITRCMTRDHRVFKKN